MSRTSHISMMVNYGLLWIGEVRIYVNAHIDAHTSHMALKNETFGLRSALFSRKMSKFAHQKTRAVTVWRNAL